MSMMLIMVNGDHQKLNMVQVEDQEVKDLGIELGKDLKELVLNGAIMIMKIQGFKKC